MATKRPMNLKPHANERTSAETERSLKVDQMIGIDGRGGIDLQVVVLLIGVLEQAVHGIEHFVRQAKEPFACDTAVVESFLAFEGEVQSAAQLARLALHDVIQRVVEQAISTDGELQLPVRGVRRAQVSELSDFVRETAFGDRTGACRLETVREGDISKSDALCLSYAGQS